MKDFIIQALHMFLIIIAIICAMAVAIQISPVLAALCSPFIISGTVCGMVSLLLALDL